MAKLRYSQKKGVQNYTQVHLWILGLILVVLISRIVMFSDSLSYFFTPKDENYHFIPLFLNYFVYAMSFMGLTEIPLCFGLLW